MATTPADKRTPTPWALRCLGGEPPVYSIFGATNTVEVAEYLWKPDAHFIVRACNAHDDLVAALQAAIPYLLNSPFERALTVCDALTAALAKAEGRS